LLGKLEGPASARLSVCAKSSRLLSDFTDLRTDCGFSATFLKERSCPNKSGECPVELDQKCPKINTVLGFYLG